MDLVKKLVVPLAMLVLLLSRRSPSRCSAAATTRRPSRRHFPRTVSRSTRAATSGCSACPVGTVDTVEPSGTDGRRSRCTTTPTVEVPADAKAVIIAPSVVGDRFVQLTPVYDGGHVLADGATLDTRPDRRPARARPDLPSIDDLTVALGPTGANKRGRADATCSRPPPPTSAARARSSTPDHQGLRQAHRHPRQQQGGAVRLRRASSSGFIGTLATQRQDGPPVQRVARRRLDDARPASAQELAASLNNLAHRARRRSQSFVKENRDRLGRNITGLNRVSKVLVKQRGALDEILDIAPLALNNLALTYNPQAGTLDTAPTSASSSTRSPPTRRRFLCGDRRPGRHAPGRCAT